MMDRLPQIDFSLEINDNIALFHFMFPIYIVSMFEVVEVFYKQKIPLVQDTKILELKLNQFVW